MSAPSPRSPEVIGGHEAPQPPMALSRKFFVIDVQADESLTNAKVLAMLEAKGAASWVVVRWADRDGPLQTALRLPHLAAHLRERPPEWPLALTLRRKPLAPAALLDWQAYLKSDAQGALVIEDGVLIGVSQARPGGTRGGVTLATPGIQRSSYRGRTAARADAFAFADDGAPAAAGAGADGGDEEPELPHRLDALMPSQLKVDQVATLVVTLDRIEQALAVAGDIPLRPGEPLEITVQGDARLQPQDDNSQLLRVPPGEDSAAVRFRFRALAAGPARVKVFAFRGGVSVGLLKLAVEVVLPHRPVDEQAESRADMLLPAGDGGARPDMLLQVLEEKTRLRFQLWVGGEKAQDYPAVEVNDLGQYMRQFVEAIEGLSIKRPETVEKAQRMLKAWGVDLFGQLIPPALQTRLWTLAERGTLTLQVCSNDAWIPWEACRLARLKADGSKEEGRFFAEAFVMTRWLHGMEAPKRFGMSRCALVVPTESGLDSATSERSFYLGLAKDGRAVTEIEPRYLPLTRALESGQYDAWHFCGHASAGSLQQGDRAVISLDGDESLSPALFAGTVENALVPRPFIFFNACQSALGGQGLTGVGGWAHRFVRPNHERRGAAVFIGTYWSVYDSSAHRFASALYEGLLAGMPIGEAARAARAKARAGEAEAPVHDPLSWLAYTLYADPLATLEVP